MSNFGRVGLEIAKIRRRLFRNYKIVRFVTFVGGGIILIAALFFILRPIANISRELLFGPVGFFSVVLPGHQEIKSTNGRTNILLLGTGGASHDGPNLTDTIIVASVKTKFTEKQTPGQFPIVLISIPRDIYLDSLKGKINTAYSIGEEKGSGAGLVLAKGAVAQIIGLQIHYAARVDFSAFQQIIDILGGVDINVEHAFDDEQYPISGKEEDDCGLSPEQVSAAMALFEPEKAFTCRFEKLHFDAGQQHMGGAVALKFARSRHAEGELEGTDFARAKRQQLVIEAIKAKVFSTNNFLHLDKILQIYNLMRSHIDTDVEPAQVNNLFKLALNFRGSKFTSVVLDSIFLDNPPIDERGWILVPKTGDWNEIHEYVKKQLK